MAITFRASTAVDTDNAATLTLDKPTGVVSGDLLVAFVGVTNTAANTVTPPSGFTSQGSWSPISTYRLHVFTKTAGASEPATYAFDAAGAGDLGGVLAALDTGGAAPSVVVGAQPSASQGSTITAPSVTATGEGVLLQAFSVFSAQQGLTPAPSGTTSIGWAASSANISHSIRAVRQTAAMGAGATTSRTVSTAASWNVGVSVAVQPANVAPNAPLLTAPADGATIDLGTTQRFDWDFSDPDPADTQSQYELRYKITTDATWTTLGGSTPNTYRDISSGTFAAGDYEWQVRTWDALGVDGPWSASSFFTAAIPTGVPTITDPTSGGTVSTNPYTVAWSTAGGQDAYQLRRVADNAGSPDGTTVYYDTGQVNGTTARSASVPFETNNRFEHIQVRVWLAGLWSSWASIRVNVSYTGPEAPTVSTATDAVGGALHIATSNPTPGAGIPATNYNDIYVRETTDPANTVVRVATLQTPNTTTTWRGPASGVDYEVQVVAFGDNGTTTASAWTGASVPMSTEYYGGGY